MKNTFRFVFAFVFIALFSLPSHSQIRQTHLYIDDGNGNFTVLSGLGTGTFSFPTGSGTLLTTANAPTSLVQYGSAGQNALTDATQYLFNVSYGTLSPSGDALGAKITSDATQGGNTNVSATALTLSATADGAGKTAAALSLSSTGNNSALAYDIMGTWWSVDNQGNISGRNVAGGNPFMSGSLLLYRNDGPSPGGTHLATIQATTGIASGLTGISLDLPTLSGQLALVSQIPAAGWSLTGNTGTVPGTNFIGTSDAELQFKIFGTKSGLIGKTNFNTGLGYGDLSNLTPGLGLGQNNTVMGYFAGINLKTASFNTVVGENALFTVQDNTSNSNTAIGALAMQNAANGSANNTALGTGALASSSTYTHCTALGDGSNVTGGFTDATAVGYDAAATASYTIQLGDAFVTDVMTSGAIEVGGASSVLHAAVSLKDGHLQSQQTTGPTAAVGSGNNTDGAPAGGATLAHATDIAGTLTITENTGGTVPTAGPQAVVTFNKAYVTPPIVIITPVNTTAISDVVNKFYYVNQSLTTVNGFTVSAGGIPTQGDVLQFNYMVIETQ